MSCTYGRAPISAAAASIFSRVRELTATRAPSGASSRAIPKPMPCEAPVTSATLPSRPRSMTRRVSACGCRVAPMPGLRLLLRIAPFLVGAVAAAVWLQRRAPRRAALAAAARARRSSRRRDEPIDIVTVVDDLLAAGR